MSVERFVQEVQDNNREELDELRELLSILDQLNRKETIIYTMSVVSNP
jgi:hypothetical protein